MELEERSIKECFILNYFGDKAKILVKYIPIDDLYVFIPNEKKAEAGLMVTENQGKEQLYAYRRNAAGFFKAAEDLYFNSYE